MTSAPGRRRGRSFLEAAELVLAETSSPLTTNELLAAMLNRKLVTTRGLTPGKSIEARLYAEAARPDARIVRLCEPGPTRARRGSVRWMMCPPR